MGPTTVKCAGDDLIVTGCLLTRVQEDGDGLQVDGELGQRGERNAEKLKCAGFVGVY